MPSDLAPKMKMIPGLLLMNLIQANIILLFNHNYLKTLVTSYFVDFEYYYKAYVDHFSPIYIQGIWKKGNLQAQNALCACRSFIFKYLYTFENL